MAEEKEGTPFQEVYDYFWGEVTDDCFTELTKDDFEQLEEEILVSAMPNFEFPHWNCKDPLDLDNKCFRVKLNNDEKKIIAVSMVISWLSYQIANIDLIRQKYSSSDFEFTSQASHLRQCLSLKEHYERRSFHLQRIYSRKEYDENGRARSSFYKLAEVKPSGRKGWTDR